MPEQGALPKRIVSINPCIDAVLMEVADPAQIAGISHYSHEAAATSIPLNVARRFPAVRDSAESIIAARPDLVLAGPHVAAPTIAALKRLGIRVEQLGVADTVAASEAQITEIAQIVGRQQRGYALNARIGAALENARWHGAAVSALIWQGSGLVPGKGTLADELLARTGFRNAASDLGLGQWDILPLERMLARPPRVLLSGSAAMSTDGGESGRMMGHPALVKARKHFHRAEFSSKLLHCGGPTIIAAVERLAAVRGSLTTSPSPSGAGLGWGLLSQVEPSRQAPPPASPLKGRGA